MITNRTNMPLSGLSSNNCLSSNLSFDCLRKPSASALVRPNLRIKSRIIFSLFELNMSLTSRVFWPF